jgi:hypothetical protein
MMIMGPDTYRKKEINVKDIYRLLDEEF